MVKRRTERVKAREAARGEVAPEGVEAGGVEGFLARLAAQCPSDRWEVARASFAADKPLVVRLNPLVAPREATEEALARLAAEAGVEARPLSREVGAWIVALPPGVPRQVVTDSPLVTGGAAYVMNPSSLLPGLALAPRPDDAVLDLCAAPGGKTLHLAALMGLTRLGEGGGSLAAVEAVKARFFKLRHLLDRFGAPATKTFLKDGRDVGAATGPRFDRVLLDAPCSSEARLDLQDPESFSTWSPDKVRACQHKQRGLLRSAFAALKPGGRLVYCTCSFSRAENEDVVADFLADAGDAAEVVDAGLDGLPWTSPPPLHPGGAPDEADGPLGLTRRVWPDGLWDGFFVAALVKRSEAPAS
jgi:16S rRNA C967 or C1407 C5-methylase (RsmB/RsmF family)